MEGLEPGAEQAEHLRIGARGLGDGERAGGADAKAGQIGFVHEGERLAGAKIIEDDHGPVDGLGIARSAAWDCYPAFDEEMRAGAHAGEAVAPHRAGMDIGVSSDAPGRALAMS